MTRLIIPDEATVATFTVTTSDATFPITYALFAKADLRITVDGVELAQADFTFSGTLLEGGGYQGGTVTLNTAAEDCEVVIWRDIAPARASQFAPSNSVPVRSIDQAFNRDMALIQDIKSDLNRTIQAPAGEELTALPSAADRAGLVLGFDSNGDPTVGVQTDPDLGALVDLSNVDPEQVDATSLSKPGGTTTSVGVSASIRYKWEESGWAAEGMGVLWPSAAVPYGWTFNKEWTATNAPGSGNGPASTMLVVSTNSGSNQNVIPGQSISRVTASGKEAANWNFISYAVTGLTGVKLKGPEIDVQCPAGTTIAEAFGLAINAFDQEIPGPAVAIDSVFGGYWSTGITVGKLSNIGSGLSPVSGAPTMGSLIDSGSAVYAIDAVVMQNTHAVRFKSTSGTNARIYADATNFLRLIPSPNGLAVRSPDNTSTYFLVDASGSVDLQTAGQAYKFAGLKVLGARRTGWATATGTATRTTFNTATVTLPQLAERFKALIDDLHDAAGHGLIGT
jgi:hypothetical protein